MATLWQELKSAARALRRAPGYALVNVLTLGLAIGACTTVYAVTYGVVLNGLPYAHADKLVQLWQLNQNSTRNSFSDPNFEDVHDQTRSFLAMAEFSQVQAATLVGTVPVRARTAFVSREFFQVFDAPPVRGRSFASDEQRPGAPGVALVSERFWQQHFTGAEPGSAIATLRMQGQLLSVVGVMPRTFDVPAGVDVWAPRDLRPRNPFRIAHNWQVVARLRDDVSLAEARQESTAVAGRLKAQFGDATWMVDIAVVPLKEQVTGNVRPVLQALLGAVVLLLAIGCANLCNLLLARVSARRRDLAVRAALGAARVSIALPLVCESLLVSTLGGLLGLMLARGGVLSVRALQPVNLPRVSEIAFSLPVVAFLLGITLLTTMLLAMVGIWWARRLDISDGLKGQHGVNTGSVATARLRSTLTVVQVAAALVLLVGAGLLGRSLLSLLSQDSGFQSDGRLAIELVSPAPDVTPTPDRLVFGDPDSLPRQARLNEQLLDRLSRLPGVLEAGGINRLPMTGAGSNGRFLIVRGDEGRTLRELAELANDPERTGNAAFVVATPTYFQTMGIPLIRGRVFAEQDGPDAPHVAVISESLARERWPREDPIGRRIQFGGMDGDLREFTIVGIVGDVRETGFDVPPRPTFYAEYRQRPLSTFSFSVVLHTGVPPGTLIPAARAIVAELMPDVPPSFRTIGEVIDETTAWRRLVLAVTSTFAVAAVLLAVLGVFGVLSYLVSQRLPEFAVRMALGAEPHDVRRLVLAQCARLVGTGLAVGTMAALALGGVVKGMLFGIEASDTLTYVAMATVLALTAAMAGYLPARRATAADPLSALNAR